MLGLSLTLPLTSPPAETLLLDLEAVVVLQNELQRLCLVAASLLVVQQVGPGDWAAVLCTLFASAPLCRWRAT